MTLAEYIFASVVLIQERQVADARTSPPEAQPMKDGRDIPPVLANLGEVCFGGKKM